MISPSDLRVQRIPHSIFITGCNRYKYAVRNLSKKPLHPPDHTDSHRADTQVNKLVLLISPPSLPPVKQGTQEPPTGQPILLKPFSRKETTSSLQGKGFLCQPAGNKATTPPAPFVAHLAPPPVRAFVDPSGNPDNGQVLPLWSRAPVSAAGPAPLEPGRAAGSDLRRITKVSRSPFPLLSSSMNWLKNIEDLSFRKLMYGSKCPDKLNYDFNKNGELRHIDTNEPFIFNYNNSCDSNHKRYEVLGHLIIQYVYELLEQVCKLKKMYIPKDVIDSEPNSFFFMSENALRNDVTLVVLLQDRGVFRAGQWDQKTIIHEGLQHGTQIPFITTALQYSWEVIVLNPNDNFLDLKTEKDESYCVLKSSYVIPKRYSSSPEEHTTYVWDHFISKNTAGKVAFIAHGYGGLVFINLLMQRTFEVMNMVYAVALVDSNHHTLHQTQGNCQVQEWIQKHCRKWISNNKPLDKVVGHSMKTDCPTVSTGTEKHSLAPSFSLQSIFRYLKNKLKVTTKAHFIRSPIATRSRKVMKKN